MRCAIAACTCAAAASACAAFAGFLRIHSSPETALNSLQGNILASCKCRDHVDELVENCRRRNSKADPQLVARLYDEFTAMDRQADALRKERNDNAASMKVRHMQWPCAARA